MRIVWILACLGLVACAPLPQPQPQPQPGPDRPAVDERRISPETNAAARAAIRRFVDVIETVEPVAEDICVLRAPGRNCDFQIVVDDRPAQAPNAFHTVDRNGRPIVAFNLALIVSVSNADELAFIMGHEAAHHINGHLERTAQNAAFGAALTASIVAGLGGGQEAIERAQSIGANLGARTYSKDFELEADRTGTEIAARAGFNPVLGAAFFARLPDPGNLFLGTHPPNAARVAAVAQEAARFGY